jgi:hypothetical protein
MPRLGSEDRLLLRLSLRRIAFILLICPVLSERESRADLESLARLVPADVLAAYMVDTPSPDGAPAKSNSFEIAAVLIDQAFALGFLNSLDIVVRGWLDTIASISNVIDHPHAVMLFDLQVERADYESHRVSSLRAALVMRARGENKRLEKRIQHLLASYTNQEATTLDSLQVDSQTVHRLQDRRLADWLIICWAQVGDYFVVAIGEESMRQVVATILSKEKTIWQEPSFREGVEALAAQHALITVLLRFNRLEEKSPTLGAKVRRMQAVLAMDNCKEGVWAAGYSGRSLEIRQWLRHQDKGKLHVIAGAEYLSEGVRSALPEAARTFAAIGVEPSVWYERIRGAFLAARSRKNAAESRAYWSNVERDAGLLFAELFSRLSGPILVHDYPEHALRLPPAWTIAVPIKGDAIALRKEIDAILTYWQKALEGGSWGLSRSADGLWFMKVGLEGPSITVTDWYLVISFSPHAVRQNLELLKTPQ